jgi:S-formylglutathione hydrolase FrmB
MDQYVGNLRRYRAISIDVGDEDGLKTDTQKLHDALDRYGIRDGFEIYHGTHTSNVAYRFQDHLIPFLARSLQFANVH